MFKPRWHCSYRIFLNFTPRSYEYSIYNINVYINYDIVYKCYISYEKNVINILSIYLTNCIRVQIRCKEKLVLPVVRLKFVVFNDSYNFVFRPRSQCRQKKKKEKRLRKAKRLIRIENSISKFRYIQRFAVPRWSNT